MGMNPRFARWSREDWQGYAPTVDAMMRRGWTVTATCPHCKLQMAADLELMSLKLGRGYSPWGKTARCRRLYCPGRMSLKAYSPRAGQYVDISGVPTPLPGWD